MALVLPLIFAALIYFLFIRPQQRQVKQHQALIESLQVGDDVLTTAGIYGTITAIDDDEIKVNVADGVELTMAKRAVAEVAVDDADEALERPASPDTGLDQDG